MEQQYRAALLYTAIPPPRVQTHLRCPRPPSRQRHLESSEYFPGSAGQRNREKRPAAVATTTHGTFRLVSLQRQVSSNIDTATTYHEETYNHNRLPTLGWKFEVTCVRNDARSTCTVRIAFRHGDPTNSPCQGGEAMVGGGGGNTNKAWPPTADTPMYQHLNLV